MKSRYTMMLAGGHPVPAYTGFTGVFLAVDYHFPLVIGLCIV